MNTAQILRDAAARVRSHWQQFDYFDTEGVNHCAVGAICRASGLRERFVASKDIVTVSNGEACRAMMKYGIGDYGEIHMWNDDHTNTAENVAVAMEFAALMWEQEQAVNAGATPLAEGVTESAQHLSSSTVKP